MKRLLVFCGAIAALSLAWSQSGPSPKAKALVDNETRWNQEYAAHELDKIVAHYVDDATVMAPGMPPMVGKAAIRKDIGDMISDKAFALKFEPTRAEIAKAGDMGFTQGSYTMTMTDPASKQVIHDHGSYVTTYRKAADGSWKAIADIASSEAPPAPPK
jgi:ketosteroid isomerase-like protein